LKDSLGREQVTRIEGVIPSRAVSAVKQLHNVQQATRTSSDNGDLLTIVTTNGHEFLPQLIEVLTQAGASIKKISPKLH
jgi:hypothetical protein